MNILVKAEINGGKAMLSTGAKSPIAPGRGNGVAKPQHCSPRFAALHKFKLMPGPPVLHPVLREASPRVFLDVSSLNLAAFRSPIFFAQSVAPDKTKTINRRAPRKRHSSCRSGDQVSKRP